ncbi:MAG: GTPase [Halobacteria archaeon]|nr:GTPase [Halobacteria archaeon]
MPTPFERIPSVDTADELVETAFSRAASTSENKSGVDSQRAMVSTASNSLNSSLSRTVEGFPSFENLDGFYNAVARAATDVDEVRQALSRVDWASGKVVDVADEAQSEMANSDSQHAIEVRKRAFARMSSVVERVDDALLTLDDARSALVGVPEVGDHPTVVLAGYPNVGKSSLLRRVTRAKPEVAEYPFTTKGVELGHFEDPEYHTTYQMVDTPGLLDRPEDERNSMEEQAVEAFEHLADVTVFVIDPSETCGYSLEDQVELRDEFEERFGGGEGDDGSSRFVTVANKTDLNYDLPDGTHAEFDFRVSVLEDDCVEELVEAVTDRLRSFRGFDAPSHRREG